MWVLEKNCGSCWRSVELPFSWRFQHFDETLQMTSTVCITLSHNDKLTRNYNGRRNLAATSLLYKST